jgi:hypothetical protein
LKIGLNFIGEYNLASPDHEVTTNIFIAPVYSTHETYRFVGVLQGRFYDEHGGRTKAWQEAREKMERAAAKKKEESSTLSCNSKWTQNEGSTIWCEDSMTPQPPSSPLVPRKDDGGRCVCIELEIARQDQNNKYSIYGDCAESAQECKFKTE